MSRWSSQQDKVKPTTPNDLVSLWRWKKQTCHFPGDEDLVWVSKMLFVSGSFEQLIISDINSSDATQLSGVLLSSEQTVELDLVQKAPETTTCGLNLHS